MSTHYRDAIRMALFYGPFIALIGLFFNIPRVSTPLMIAYVVYLVARLAIPGLMKFGLSHGQAAITIFGVFIFLMTYPIVKLVPTIKEQARNVEYYIPKIENFLQTEYDSFRVMVKREVGYEINEEYVTEIIQQMRNTLESFLLNVPKLLANLLEWYFLIPLFVFFLLKDGHRLRTLIFRITPNSIFESYYNFSHQFNKQLGDYIFAKFIEASIIGIITTTGLWLLDVRFALLLGLVAALTNIIPYLGPILGAAPALIFGMVEYGFGPQTGGILLLYAVANVIDITLVFPILVSKIVDLHPIVVVVSVILGSQYLGIVGMIVSIPMAVAFKLLFQELYRGVYSSSQSLPHD